MTLTIELRPEEEEALREAATRRGVSVTDYAKTILAQSLLASSQGGNDPTTLEAFEAGMDELATIGAHLPPPAAGETYSRDTIYADHD